MTSLTLIRGIPGSGKTTLARQLMIVFGETGAHFEADQYFEKSGTYEFDMTKIGRAHYECQMNTYKALTQGKNVIVSNTFTMLKEIDPYADMCFDFNIIPQIIICQGTYGSIHNVPDETMDRMRKRFQYAIPHAD